MTPIHDYLLVEEAIPDTKLDGTNLTIKYDDSERFMYVKVIEVSSDIQEEILKMYSGITNDFSYADINRKLNHFAVGNILIINRVAKTPYKDGKYFISIKDVIAVEEFALGDTFERKPGILAVNPEQLKDLKDKEEILLRG